MSKLHIARIVFAFFTALAPLTALPTQARQGAESIPFATESPLSDAPAVVLGAIPIRCFATPDSGSTVFSSGDGGAVRQALIAASPGGTVKVAGYCAGVTNQGGNNQVALITQTLTLAGGYTTTNWTTAYPITQPATLDALSAGRGIYVDATATLQGLVVANGSVSGGNGGGLYAAQAITLSGMTVVSSSSTGGFPSGQGGGAYFEDVATVSGSAFTGNSANFQGGGGSFKFTASVTGSTFSGNSAGFYGGGAYFNVIASVNDSSFSGNRAGGSVTSVDGPASLSGGAADGGGAYFNSQANVSGSSFARNAAGERAGGAYFTGPTSLSGSSFGNNTAGDRAGGAIFDISGAASVTGSTFTRNTAVNEGGGALFLSTAYVTSSTFATNTAGSQGGGAQFSGHASVTASAFVSNTAAFAGGGAYLSGGTGVVVNSLFARNGAPTGAGLYVDSPTSLNLIHSTFAYSGTGGSAAIYVDTIGTVRLTNTLISNHLVGIERGSSGSVFEDYSLFSDVTTPYVGSFTSGGHSITGTAGFVNPVAGDYHLGAGSSAINAGVNAGIANDFEGDPRPIGAGFDIGYDEYKVLKAWLPQVQR